MYPSPVGETDLNFVATRIKFCFDDGQVDPEDITLETTIWKLTELPESTITYLAGILRNLKFQEESDYALDRMLIYMVNKGTPVQDIEDIACILATNELVLMQSSDYFEWDIEGTMPTDMLRELVLGLRWYGDIEGFAYDRTKPLRLQGTTVIDQCNALISMACHMEMVHEYQLVPNVTVVPDVEIVELVVSYPSRLMEIITLLEENDYDAHGLGEVMSGEVHRSLASGSL